MIDTNYEITPKILQLLAVYREAKMTIQISNV